MTETVEQRYLSAREAATYTGKSHRTLRVAAEAGEVGFQNSKGGRWYFTRDELDSWMRGET